MNAELVGHGLQPFGFFAPTPFGLVVLALGIGYMLLARRWLGDATPSGGTASRQTIADLLAAYALSGDPRRVVVDADSELGGRTLAELDLARTHGVVVLSVETGPRWHRVLNAADGTTRLTAGDALTVQALAGRSGQLEQLASLGLMEVAATPEDFAQQTRQVGVAELMVPPTSVTDGLKVRDLDLIRRHQLTAIGVRHRGKVVAETPASVRVDSGDTILVTGEWAAIQRFGRRSDLVLLDLPAEVEETAPAGNQARFALASLLVMVVLMVTGWVPNVLAALIAALLMGATGCIDMPSAYRAIHWPTLLVIVGMLPFAQALERTGGVDLAAQGLLALVGGAPPGVVLAAIFAATALIGLFVSNTATAVLMAPVAIATATQLGASPYPFAMTVALAASAAFMTPVSSPVNTLIVEPGRYRFSDFLKLGTPFTILVMIVVAIMVPLVMPLHP